MGVDNITLGGSLDVDSSVDPITVQSVGPVGPVTVAGIPDPIKIKVVDPLPEIKLNIDPVDLNLDVEPLTINPVDLSLRLKEIPDVRVHLPADFCVGLAVMGFELLTVRLCGEAQAITEPYERNPCEVCGPIGPPRSTPQVNSVLTLRE